MTLCQKKISQSTCHHLEGEYKNMRKVVYSLFIITILFACSTSLTSCKAITAQNITNTASNQGMNGGGGMNGGPGMNGNKKGTRNSMDRMANADLMGKIVSMDGNTIKIQLAKETKNNKSQNSNSGKQDVNANQNVKDTQNTNGSQNNNNNSNKRPQGGSPGGKFELSYTGELKTLTVNNDVKISERTSMSRQNGNDNSKSSIKVSDLKKSQVIMIWYKQNTKTVERISVVQS